MKYYSIGSFLILCLLSSSYATAGDFSFTADFGSEATLKDWSKVTGTSSASLKIVPNSSGVLVAPGGAKAGDFLDLTQEVIGTSLKNADLKPEELTQSFTLDFHVLANTVYDCIWAALVDDSGKHGYGVFLNSDPSGGKTGTVDIFKMDMDQFPLPQLSNFRQGESTGGLFQLGSVAEGLANDIYPATASSGSNYASSFLDLKLTWSANGVLTLSENGKLLMSVTDTSYKSFSQIFVEGDEPGGGRSTYIDSIEVVGVDSTSVPTGSGGGLPTKHTQNDL